MMNIALDIYKLIGKEAQRRYGLDSVILEIFWTIRSMYSRAMLK